MFSEKIQSFLIFIEKLFKPLLMLFVLIVSSVLCYSYIYMELFGPFLLDFSDYLSAIFSFNLVYFFGNSSI